MIRSPLFLSITALWLALAVAEFARPCFFLHDDNATSFVGMYVHDFRVLSETGRVAEVNYFQYGGEPFLEQGQSAVLYPPVYLGVALAKWISGDARWTIEWIAAGHLTLGLAGFYFWLRRGRVEPWIAALAGLAWVLCPFIMIFASSWVTATYVAAWLPWVFWALDRLFARPTILSAIFLGSFLGFFFLQGYVQWVVYSVLFMEFYALLRLIERTELRRGAIIFHLILAAMIFFIFALPLLLPLLPAMDASAARGQKVPLLEALFYRVEPGDLLRAQVGLFRPNLIFGGSTAIIFCPALLLAPLMVWRFFKVGPKIQRRLFALLLLAVFALIFSGRWHYVLGMLPLLEKFRWPLKMFIFVDFFLIAALAWSVTTCRSRRRAMACVGFVLVAGATVSLAGHDANFFSQATLPSSLNPLPDGVDTKNWRMIATGDIPEDSSWKYLTHGYATFYGIPSLGGYDPLVTYDRLDFAAGLDFPNIFRGKIDAEQQKILRERGVRYWIMGLSPAENPGFKTYSGGRIRETRLPSPFIFTDAEASPIVYLESDPKTPLGFTYSGNSMRIPLNHATSPVEISVGPTDGWWYRTDRGPWLKPEYRENRLKIVCSVNTQLLEVSYYDSRFYRGLKASLYLAVITALTIFITLFIRLKSRAQLS